MRPFTVASREFRTLALSFTVAALIATQPALAACPGDCDGSGQVTVDEILRGVNIALGSSPVTDCLPFDFDGDGRVTVDEIVQAVGAALNGCPPDPSTTPTEAGNTPLPTATQPPGPATGTPVATPTTTPTPASTSTPSSAITATVTPTPTSTPTATDGTPGDERIILQARGNFPPMSNEGSAGLSMAATSDGRFLYVAENDTTIVVRDQETMAFLHVLSVVVDEEALPPTLLGLSPDERHLYAIVDEFYINAYVIDQETGIPSFIETETGGDVFQLCRAIAMALSPDGKHLYVIDEDNFGVAIFERDLVSGELHFVAFVEDFDFCPLSLAIFEDSKHVYVGTDFALRAYERDSSTGLLETLQTIETFPAPGAAARSLVGAGAGPQEYEVDYATAMTASSGGHTLFVGTDNFIGIFDRDPQTGVLAARQVVPHGNGLFLSDVRSVTPLKDEQVIVVANAFDNAISFLDYDTETERYELGGVERNIGPCPLSGLSSLARRGDDENTLFVSAFARCGDDGEGAGGQDTDHRARLRAEVP